MDFIYTLFGVDSEGNMGQGIVVNGNNSIIGSELNPNFVGGNNSTGIQLSGSNIQARYNYIGVDENANKVGNCASGLVVFYNGGDLLVDQNIIGDNEGTGFYLVGDVNGQNINNNYIGVSPDGTNIGNEVSGIYLEGAINAQIWRNRIAYNGLDGITLVGDSEGVVIYQNYMHSNARQGIDLGCRWHHTQ